jgi:hypothetical protein
VGWKVTKGNSTRTMKQIRIKGMQSNLCEGWKVMRSCLLGVFHETVSSKLRGLEAPNLSSVIHLARQKGNKSVSQD